MYRKIFTLFGDLPVLETEHLILRRMKPKDYLDMFAYAKDPEVSRFLLWEPHEDAAYTKKYLRFIKGEYDRFRFCDWAVTLKENGKMIGTCGFTSFSERHAVCEIGYVINPAFQGRGYATEAAFCVMSFAFTALDIERVEARHMEGNYVSAAVMMKLGMKREGVLRNAVKKRGVSKNVTLYSILREDYEKGLLDRQ